MHPTEICTFLWNWQDGQAKLTGWLGQNDMQFGRVQLWLQPHKIDLNFRWTLTLMYRFWKTLAWKCKSGTQVPTYGMDFFYPCRYCGHEMTLKSTCPKTPINKPCKYCSTYSQLQRKRKWHAKMECWPSWLAPWLGHWDRVFYQKWQKKTTA